MDNQGKRRGERGSALWGTGHRGGGDGRSRTTWRSWRIVGMAIAVVVLALPVAESAAAKDYGHSGYIKGGRTYV